jgi:DNA-binding LacI/PurR family transcriptional regulator
MTLFDLARELNVSISTISRALSRPEMVAPATREKVLAAVKQFGFQPNEIARSLRTRQTKTIGIIVPDITNWFFGVIVKAVGEVAKSNGYSVLVCNADEDPAGEEHALNLLRDRKVSGIINCPMGANLKLWRELKKTGIPVVELDRVSGLEKVDTVVLDNEKAADMAAAHLIGLGHHRIATIAGPQHLSNGRARFSGFKKALRKNSIPLPPEYVEYGDFREGSGHDAAKTLVSLQNPPTAIFIANSEMAGGAIGALRECRVKIPTQLSVVAFDDAHWARYLDPPLTVIAEPTEAMGRCAAELLLARLNSRSTSRKLNLEVFPAELIVRKSTAPLRLARARAAVAVEANDRRQIRR